MSETTSNSNLKNPAPGDPATEYVRLLNRHERRLAAFVMSLVPNWADAEEIIQETRLRLWEQFGEYERDKDFGAWACTIARYLVLAYRKRVGRDRARFSDAFAEAVAMGLAEHRDEPSDLQRALAGCLQEIAPKNRDMLRSFYSGEATVPQIADRYGRTASAVYKALAASRGALYDCIRGSLDRESAQ